MLSSSSTHAAGEASRCSVNSPSAAAAHPASWMHTLPLAPPAGAPGAASSMHGLHSQAHTCAAVQPGVSDRVW